MGAKARLFFRRFRGVSHVTGTLPMNPTASFLGEQLRAYDPLVVSVAEVAGQGIRATIERVYSARFSGPVQYAAGATLHFVGAPGSWGNVTLKPSERALVFVAYIASSKRHYQCPWHGHFSLEDAAAGPLAVANWRLLDMGPWEPEALW